MVPTLGDNSVPLASILNVVGLSDCLVDFVPEVTDYASGA